MSAYAPRTELLHPDAEPIGDELRRWHFRRKHRPRELESGSLLSGEARQANYVSEVPRPDGPSAPMNHPISTCVELHED